MKYINTFIFASIFFALCPLPVTAELVIDVDPSNIDSQDQDTSETGIDNVENQPEADVIKFSNKDILHGKMLSMEPQKGILWKSDDVLQNILFAPRNVRKIEFGGNISHNRKSNATVLLTNDDVLGGKLVSMNEKALILDTQYGGKITIDSHMVRGIFPGENNPSLLYSGPNDMDEWVLPENRRDGKISINNSTLSMSGYCAIGRDMKLTAMSKIEFSFEIAGNCQMQLLFYGDEAVSSPQNCYALYLSSGYIYLQSYGKHGRSGNLGNVKCRDLQSGKGQITLLLDKKNKTITLLLNDAMIKQWVDTQESGDGTFVSFVNQSQGTMKIRDIEISRWNGKVPGSKNRQEDGKKDIIVFVNADQVTGILESITNNEAVFKTEYAELKIPLKRIKQIRTGTEKQHKARRNAGDVRFQFANGDKLTLDLAKIVDGRITGKSENFGAVEFSLNAFKTIELNIYSDDDDTEE